jgi:hypothetical protein
MRILSPTCEASSQHDHSTLTPKIILGVGLLLCATLIFVAARGDLWLDEVWSIFFAESARSPWDILSLYKHDNNHVLNTFYLYVVGKQDRLILYRLFSLITGVGSLYLLARIALRWGQIERVFVLLLAGFSYPLILYFSEARGYGPAIFFALLSFSLIEENSATCNPLKVFFFWLASCCGFLSHLSFAIVFLSLSVWVIHKEVAGQSPLKLKVLGTLRYLFIPFLFLILFYLYYARGMAIGGGDHNNPFLEMSRGIVYLLGLPLSAVSSKVAVLILFATVTLIGAYLFWRDKKNPWSFFVAVLLLAPLTIIVVTRPKIYYFRYLVITFPFFYLVLSFIFGKLFRTGRKGFYLVLGVLCLYLIGQAHHLLPLFKQGRGNYQAILAEISNGSSGNILTIGSDHDFRNKMLLTFYQRFLPDRQTLRYMDQQRWNIETPEWIIIHSTDISFEPKPFVMVSNQRIYELTRSERSSGNSGFSWFLYHLSRM